MCLSPSGVELGGSKEYVWNLIMYRNGTLDLLWGSMLPKIRIISKKASNKRCSELNFVPKNLRAHMSISSTSGARGLQRSVYVMRFRKLWLRVKLVNFDFSAKLPSTDYNESNKPTLKSLSHIGSEKSLLELGVTKNELLTFSHFSLYYGTSDSLWSSTLPKIRIISKKASNKNCSELNFVAKNLRAHMSISLTSGARKLQRSVYVMRFKKLWLRVKSVNFDFSAKLPSTGYNESNKPTPKSLSHIGSEKSLVELRVTENELLTFSHFSLY